MILGMTTATYTFVHVLLGLIGIGAGLVVLFGLISGKRLDRWTMLFLATTLATSLTGFGFPNDHVTPGIVIGILSVVVLAIAIFARYGRHLAGAWRRTYVICASIALYFNVFVAVVQMFEKVPALKTLAPTAVRASLRGDAGRCSGAARNPRFFRRHQVSRYAAANGLNSQRHSPEGACHCACRESWRV